MNNYEFCASFAERHGKSGRVLDYGCGEGQIVSMLRDRGIDAYGCDVFYEGGSFKGPTGEGPIRRMDGSRIPFPDAHFDVVVNNQVMEHVPDLDVALSEISRVLKPGGVVLSLFPDKGVWREGHCGVPFLHWFPKGSSARVYYAAAFRAFGFGHFHGNKTIRKWAEDFCHWLDKWTYYRGEDEIREAFASHIGLPRHIEAQWLDARLERRVPIPNRLKATAAKKLAGMVFWCRKNHDVEAVKLM